MIPVTPGATTARPSHGSGGLDGLLLDIGGGVGALVVSVDGRWVDREIEVSPTGREADAHRTHTVVHEHRPGVFAAVFMELVADSYTIWHPFTDAAWGEIAIEGGAITELDLRAGVS